MEIADDFEMVVLSKDHLPEMMVQMEKIKSQIQQNEIKVLNVTRSSRNELVIVFKRRDQHA
ncbi:hypothetical protein [Alicyclobacillus acidoterrestris]|uniref:Uncharacterized protein n=1 Tax=Alicyclobacillus acidoterrestris (strain ATCC 49025 / DSM 3922 / CIP 106132 / NCIMB 13137 / GD3B) TaxID=1356854 RepID=T0BRC3_ALIAG|nr:hypothetical protein [Alicyclobacillus acidoterrestris]EPZ43344.1 hypothetical protein N007_13035 [Alicyclobacillus acidoterrestris ATCC 49025]UNO48781.1 hypothetical protein K1I37_19415 [Alicyclobacillus acidoterrestris]